MTAKTKVLSLALLGLAGFGFAGSALAGCPASPVPPWTAVVALSGTATIVSGGYAGTPCRLDSVISAGATSGAFATVEDDSPAAEPRYRMQFIIDADTLSTGGQLGDGVFAFSTVSATTGTVLSLSVIVGSGGANFVGYIVKNPTDPSGYTTGTLPLQAGENHVEIDYDTGAVSGSPHFSMWVNNNVEGSPDLNVTAFSNTDTIDTAFLGLAGPTASYASHFGGVPVGFDQFDSRRQTFIGF